MKFIHLSDLHIGRGLHQYSLKEDQRVILGEIAEYAEKLRPDAVVIAGDIYDKSVPSAEAVVVFDEFLTRLTGIKPKIPVLVISGNHDSSERLEYAASILKNYDIHLSGFAPERPPEHMAKVMLEDEYGEVDFYLLPFLKPAYVKHVCEDRPPETYGEAVRLLVGREDIDYQSRRNVLISHQFYTGGSKALSLSDSEILSVGGLDQVEAEIVSRFDYVALGHLHREQTAGAPHIRYCGTPLKYSVSEWNDKKTLTLVTLGPKGEEPVVEHYPLHPVRDVRKKTGTLKEIIDQAVIEERDDYVSITLTDETDPYKPKEQLEKVYSHILELKIDNRRTRQKLAQLDQDLTFKDPVTAFCDFYREMQGAELNDSQRKIVENIFDKAEEEV